MKAEKQVKPTLSIVRPINGKGLVDGWTLALNTRHGINPLGEDAIAKFLALPPEKRTAEAERAILKEARNNPLVKATRQITDIPHLIATAFELCVKFEYRPARIVRLFGEGARKLCADIDAIRAKSAGLRKLATEATAKMLESAKSGKVDKRTARAFADATAKAETYDKETRKPAERKYKADALAALALVSSMADFRTAADK